MLTDDSADGKPSKGTVTYVAMVPKSDSSGGTYRVREERESFPYTLKNGETGTWQVTPEDKISGFSVNVMQGGVNSRLEQPEKGGAIPPAWSKAPQPAQEASSLPKTDMPLEQTSR